MIKNVLHKSVEFGSFTSREHYVSFLLKMFMYFIPALFLSHIIDESIGKLYKNIPEKSKYKTIILLLLFQTVIIISLMYLFIHIFEEYTSEFQLTLAGGIFIAFFYSFQTNYINKLKDIMKNYIL